MSHVKLINKESSLTQVIPIKTWQDIQSNKPNQSKNLEFLFQCDDEGNKMEEDFDGENEKYSDNQTEEEKNKMIEKMAEEKKIKFNQNEKSRIPTNQQKRYGEEFRGEDIDSRSDEKNNSGAGND